MMREAFETWYAKEYSEYALKFYKFYKDGKYQNLDTELAWQSWQASMNYVSNRYPALEQELAELKKHNKVMQLAVLEQLAIDSQAVLEEPVLYQYRCKYEGNNTGWSEWKSCTKEQAREDYTKSPVLHGWRYETRELYVRNK